jgi:hypothetical protein
MNSHSIQVILEPERKTFIHFPSGQNSLLIVWLCVPSQCPIQNPKPKLLSITPANANINVMGRSLQRISGDNQRMEAPLILSKQKGATV